jgi:predicted dehydrogenase
MSGDRLGVAVVGAGHMGERHARAWQGLGVPVRALVDPDRARAAALAAEVGAEPVAALEPVLDRGDVAAVSVCTPTSLHAEVAVAALEAGKHVMWEKPVALTLADAARMRAAAAAHDRLLRIGFHRRFESASLRILELGPGLGRPLMAQATITAGVRPKRTMHDAHGNGGPVIDMCCHLFDQWALLFGERCRSVHAHGAVLADGRPELAGIERLAIDSAQITLAYPSGGLAQLFVSWGLPPGVEALERHSYLGPEGLLEVDWPQRLTLHDANGSREERPADVDPIPLEIAGFHAELQRPDERTVATVDDGVEALRESLAVLDSIAAGGEVVVVDRGAA